MNEPPELWLPIEGYEGRYSVSTRGRVLSHMRYVRDKGSGRVRRHKGRIMKPVSTGTGYLMVHLYRDGEGVSRKLHVLVMRAFIGEAGEGREICHGPGGPHDNSLFNLRYDTRSENKRDGYRFGTTPSKLTPEAVLAARQDGADVSELAALHGVTPSTIRRAATGETWGWVKAS